MRRSMEIRIVVPALIGAVLGCSPGEDSFTPITFYDLATTPLDLAVVVPPDLTPPPPGRIEGVVYDFNQSDVGVVPRATVVLVGGGSTTTDADGRFAFDPVTPSARVLVRVSHAIDPIHRANYSVAEVAVAVRSGETSYVYPRLLEGCYSTVLVAKGTPGKVALPDLCRRSAAYASLAWEADGIAAADGTAFAGRMRVEMAPVPFPAGANALPDLSWYVAVPGDLSAVRKDGSAVILSGYGASEFRLVDAGNAAPLQVAANHNVTLQLQVYQMPAQGQEVVGWSFDTDKGRWVEEAAGSFKTVNVGGVVVPDGGSPPDGGIGGIDYPVFEIVAPHLSWWASASPLSKSACVRGTITAGGKAAAGVEVVAVGGSFGGVTAAVAGADGTYCMDLTPGAAANLNAVFVPTPLATFRGATSVSAPVMPGTSCAVDTSKCVDVGTFDIPAVISACAAGRFHGPGPIGSSPPLSDPIDLYADLVLSPADQSAGKRSRTYVGRIIPGVDGRFCEQFIGGASYTFADPSHNCMNGPIAIAAVNSPVLCGGDDASCQQLGDISFFCGS